MHKPTLVTQPTPKPPHVPHRPVSGTPQLANQPTFTKTTTMTKPETMTNTTTNNTPPPVSSTPAKSNQMETILITMQQFKDFFDNEMAIFQARLKKKSNILIPSAENSHLNRPQQ